MRQLHLPMLIWDLPTRLFHWVLVVLLLTSWLTAEFGLLRQHMVSGLAVLALLLFRILWGFIGSDTARFARFVRSPAEAARHLMHITRREPDRETGHNAAGGWMVLFMIAVLLAQVATGLCSNDDAVTEGPLALKIGKDNSDWMTHLHHLNFVVIEIVVALHLVAIILYRVLKGQNLLTPMITGKKRLPGATPAPRMMHPVVGLVGFGLAAVAVVVFTVVVGYSP